MKDLVIGVLALQGAFSKHAEMLEKLGVKVVEVRKTDDLAQCDALIIPGGESTTIMKHMVFIEIVDAIRQFAKSKPIFGTCAGLILMAKDILRDTMQPFNFLDIVVERNAFGRQAESFQTEVEVSLKHGHHFLIPAIFIRAPRIREVGVEVKVLATFENEPVLIQQGHHLGSTFHPELTDDISIHSYFLRLVSSVSN